MDDKVRFLRGFGSQINTIRRNRGLTQKEFAKIVGISPSYIASIEAGRRWPRINILYSIASSLGVATHELFRSYDVSGGQPMNESDTPTPPLIDKFLDDLQSEANEKGYPSRIILNMRHHSEMLDIMLRVIGAELEYVKEGRTGKYPHKKK